MSETMSLPRCDGRPSLGRGRHAQSRRTFALGRHSLLGSQSRARRRRRAALRGAVRPAAPVLVVLGLLVPVMVAAWLAASLWGLPEPTVHPVLAWSIPGEVCVTVDGDLFCYYGES